jgi:hypothetical protein
VDRVATPILRFQDSKAVVEAGNSGGSLVRGMTQRYCQQRDRCSWASSGDPDSLVTTKCAYRVDAGTNMEHLCFTTLIPNGLENSLWLMNERRFSHIFVRFVRDSWQ